LKTFKAWTVKVIALKIKVFW